MAPIVSSVTPVVIICGSWDDDEEEEAVEVKGSTLEVKEDKVEVRTKVVEVIAEVVVLSAEDKVLVAVVRELVLAAVLAVEGDFEVSLLSEDIFIILNSNKYKNVRKKLLFFIKNQVIR